MIKLIDITKKYGDKTVYEKFNLSLDEKKVTVILGESGAGKTTLLNIMASLTDYSGEIEGLPTDRRVSFVFQKDRLVPNLTVRENLLLTSENADVASALAKTGLSEYENKYPSELSAGMARRVAILRAFLFDSPVILMDEPFINLDPALKYSIMEMFLDMQRHTGRTAVSVTHDVNEAIYIADRIIVISGGRVVYDNPEVTEADEKKILAVLLKTGKTS